MAADRLMGPLGILHLSETFREELIVLLRGAICLDDDGIPATLRFIDTQRFERPLDLKPWDPLRALQWVLFVKPRPRVANPLPVSVISSSGQCHAAAQHD